MRALRIITYALLLFVVLPTTIVGVLGLVLSPFQPTARATQSSEMIEVNDLMLSEAVKEEVQRVAEEAPVSSADAGIFEVVEPSADAEASAEPEEAPLVADGDSEPVSVLDESVAVEGPRTAQSLAYVLDEEPVSADTGAQYGYLAAQGSDEALAAECATEGYYSGDELRNQGVIANGGVKYTWYSQRVLPGGGLNIEGRHVSDEGYVMDAQGRIVVASSDLPYGTEIDVPFGNGAAVVLDTGCPSGVIDVYTDF